MSGRWQMFLDRVPWDGSARLMMVVRGFRGEVACVKPFELDPDIEGQRFDTPTLQQSREESQDACGDVDGFLQAALDCAWEAGMRPRGFADHTNELAAVRYHLEDMRALAKVPPR